jgi:hypothetical protein
MSTNSQRNALAAVVIVVGILALVAGIIYLTVAAKSLPSFMGSLAGMTGHRSKRGIAGVVVGAVLLLAGGGLLAYRRS